MPLRLGTRLGVYEVVSLLGAGGMGEVYRARDTKLGRDVALKVLADLSADDDRAARLAREARMLAALNHPNVGVIYGVEDADGVTALVLELVDGPTLAERIARGRMSPAEALNIAEQIAAALQAAHAQGIIHRDLKPANVKLRPDGTVKVLDFGLAKALVSAADGALTLTAAGTQSGFIVGTPAYMSPEQARGEAVDAQTDVWSFGVILYELLTGVSPFARASVADTLAAVVGAPPDLSRLPSDTPAIVRHVVHRCLESDRMRRLRDMGDVRTAIEDARHARVADEPTPARSSGDRRWRAGFAAVALAAIVGAGAWWLARRSPQESRQSVVRLSLPVRAPNAGTPWGTYHVAISPDGSRLAFSSASELWVRPLGEQQGIRFDISTSDPFFSPNGQRVGFFDGGVGTQLRTVSVLGGASTLIATSPERPVGGAWGRDGTIVFATGGGLFRVPEAGGEPQLLAKPDPLKSERRYAWPQFMPDGRSVVFTITLDESIETAQIALLDLQTRAIKVLVKGGTAARYVPTGHLLYTSGQTLKAIAYDSAARQTSGDPISLTDIPVAAKADNGAAEFAVSDSGTLLFVAPTSVESRQAVLTWIDRAGREEPLSLAPGRYSDPRVSPDGSRIALDIPGAPRNIWLLNLARGSLVKLTDGPTEDLLPVWSPSGERIFFASDRSGNFDVYSQAADGAGRERVELARPGSQMLNAVTPDGRRLLVWEDGYFGLFSAGPAARVEPLLHDHFAYGVGVLSPDGTWIAYESNESGGQTEVFLRPFPDVNARREQVSINGGRFPLFDRRGSGELYFIDPDGMMTAVDIRLAPSLVVGRATKLFQTVKPPRGIAGRPYDQIAARRSVHRAQAGHSGCESNGGRIRRVELVY